MRIALLTLEALVNARAVRRFVAAHAAEIALVGLSDPFRPEAGGSVGQTWRRLRQSGPRILPYLALNFGLPRAMGALPFGRAHRRDVAETPLATLCRERAIPAFDVRDVNGAAFRTRLAASGADLILTFHFDQILSADTIASVTLGGINVHPSLLPRHRGPVPTIHALLDRPVELGVSIHRLAPKIDAGALLAQATLADSPELSAIAAAAALHEAALPLLDVLLADIAAGLTQETALPILPYRGFPTPAEMVRLARSGRAAAGRSDLAASLRTPILPAGEPP